VERLVRVELHDDDDFNYVLQLINDEIGLYGEAREVKKEICTDGIPLAPVKTFEEAKAIQVEYYDKIKNR